MPKFHILGLGSMGAIIATSLQNLQISNRSLGIEIVPVLRNKSKVDLFREKHNFVLTINQLYHKPSPKTVVSEPFELTTCPETIVASKEYIETLIVTTKTYQTVEALKPLWDKKIIDENTNIVLIQNGLGMLEVLVDSFPEIERDNYKIFQGVISHGVYMKNYPNEFNHAGYMDLKVALIHNTENTLNGIQSLSEVEFLKNTNKMLEVFQHLDLDCKILSFQELIVGQIEKFCVNCCINSNTTILNCLNGKLLVNEVETRNLFSSVMNEIVTLFSQSKKYKNIFQYYELLENLALDNSSSSSNVKFTHNVDLSKLKNMDKLLDFIMDAGCVKNFDNSSSMRQDAINKRDTEIDFINGYVVKLCLNELNLPVLHCGVNNTITTLVKIKSDLLKQEE